MSVYNFFILTPAENNQAMTYDNVNVQLGARAIDGSNPGVGINLNPDATNYAAGAAVTLDGNFVGTRRIVSDPDYQMYAPDMITYLLTLPWATLDSDTIFAPPSGGPGG